jgi:ribose transport system permease protein
MPHNPRMTLGANDNMQANAERRSWRRIFSDLGMVGVLLLLCAYFTWATWGIQYRDGAEGAAEVLAALPADAARGVVVVGQQGGDAEEFVTAVVRGLAQRNIPVLGAVRGEPMALREKLDELATKNQRPAVILATHEVATWRLVRNLTNVTVVSPQPYQWADFLTRRNLSAMTDREAVIAIIGIGMTMVILTGGIDLSVGSLIALSAVVVSRLIAQRGGAEHATAAAMFLCSAAAVAACAVAGLVCGVMSTAMRVPPFIVTLAVMLIASGLAYELSNGESINALPESFVALGRGRSMGVPNTVWLMAALYAAAAFVMARTTLGRWVYAIGGNRESAFYAGIPVRRVIVTTYVASAALAGVGGIVEASRLRSGSPTYGLMAELSVIAAVVVGGTSLTGGKGSVPGTLVGALIIAVIENGMNLTGVGAYRQKIVLGAVILAAVLLDQFRNRGRIARWA